MKIVSDLFDSRINAQNLLVEMTISEYEGLVKDVILKNDFQRRRVRSSKTIYALLREDLLKQCIIPPIVLALTNDVNLKKANSEDFNKELTSNKDHLVILDGLQRTHTIFDLLNDLRVKMDEEQLNRVYNIKLRVEIYVGLNRLGILYRMLTLNTGQTPMSLRQQIEMLYLDYISKEIDGVELIREADGRVANRLNQYNFKDIIEGFNAYLDRDELPIDKANILENINSLEKLSKIDQKSELFEQYLSSLNAFIVKITDLCQEKEITQEFIDDNGSAFGKNASQIFKKPQSISGFGAAVGKLMDFAVFSEIADVKQIIDELKIDEPVEFLEEINTSLLWLKKNSKKIGNAQRSYFAFFYRDLLNSESDSYKSPKKASKTALHKYRAQNM